MRKRNPLLAYDKFAIKNAYNIRVWERLHCNFDPSSVLECPITTIKWRDINDQLTMWCSVCDSVVDENHPLCEESDFNKLILEEVI